LSMSAANRSRIAIVLTPSGEVEIARQQWRSETPNSRWEWEWVARRRAEEDWCRGASAREAIGWATGLHGGAWPGWLTDAAQEAERKLSP
jgi:hypothetical protein